MANWNGPRSLCSVLLRTDEMLCIYDVKENKCAEDEEYAEED